MKKMWGTRVLAMLLVLALTAGLVPAALAANSEAAVAFKQVPNDTLDTLIRPDVAVGEIEDAEMGEDTAAYQAHDLVRVSIILEDTSTLEAYSDAAAEGTLAEDAAAVSYRAALQRKQDSVVRKISSTILGREDLDVVWNLTLVANMISANVEYGKIEQIKQLPGVADVVLEQQYEPAASENTVQPNMEISTGMTGTTTAWSTGYTGAGMRIAIIDTGLDMSHQSFDNGAYEYALEQNAARAKESVEAYKASLDRFFASLQGGSPEQIDAELEELLSACEKGSVRTVRSVGVLMLVRCLRILREINPEYSQIFIDSAIQDRIYEFKSMWEFRRLAQDMTMQMRTILSDRQNQTDWLITEVNDFIAQNYCGHVTLAEIADSVHVNRSYLSRIYKERTGKNVFDVINARRVEKAKELLQTTNMRVYEVALFVGFEDAAYFSRFFKRYTGVSPKKFEYRGGNL